MEQEKDKVVGGYTLIPDSISSIPATELPMIEKVLLCRIISLSKDKPCEISNAALASRFGVTGRRITGHIAGLKQKGWIDVTGPRTKRYIRPTSKALSLWSFPSIDGNSYRRKHLKTEPSPTIDGTVLNYRRNRLPKNTENTESTDISANQDLHKQTSRSQSTRKKFVPPSLDEVKQYVAEKKLAIDARCFFDFYTAGEWHDSSGKPVHNWKQKALTWDRREQKKSKPPAQGSVSVWDMQELTPEEERRQDEEAKALLERLNNRAN